MVFAVTTKDTKCAKEDADDPFLSSVLFASFVVETLFKFKEDAVNITDQLASTGPQLIY